mgnify:CR=1 FL=1
MILRVILEGLGLGALLVLVCAAGIRNGAVGMVHLYSGAVQARCVELGLTTQKKIKRNSKRFKALCLPGYIAYVLVCVYAINGARGFLPGFWQLFVILSIMNLIDRFLIDDYWVGHTKAWTIPGTEDLKPYITVADKRKKWTFGTLGMLVISALLAALIVFPPVICKKTDARAGKTARAFLSCSGKPAKLRKNAARGYGLSVFSGNPVCYT